MIRGFDWSNNQGNLDAEQAAFNGFAFCFHKASQGTTFADPYYHGNIQGILNSGMQPGAFHYATPQRCQPIDEAQWFIDVTHDEASGMIPILDIEDDEELGPVPNNAPLWAAAWLSKVELHYGVKPLIYLNPNLMRRLSWTPVAAAGYGLWLAAWGGQLPLQVKPWSFAAFWQQRPDGKAYPTGPDCCVDFFNGSVARLPLYGLA